MAGCATAFGLHVLWTKDCRRVRQRAASHCSCDSIVQNRDAGHPDVLSLNCRMRQLTFRRPEICRWNTALAILILLRRKGWANLLENWEAQAESEDITSRGVYFFLPAEIENGSSIE
jgi:hypothetical protein